MLVRLTACSFVLLLGACGPLDDPVPGPPSGTGRAGSASGGQIYEATGTVLESRDHGPELCVGVVLDSLPPQCDGVPLDDWDWDGVGDEESRAGTTWGSYHVTGFFEGERFGVVGVGPPHDEGNEAGDPIGTPCPEPEGGWTPSDPDRWSHDDLSATARVARRDPAYSGLWVEYIKEFDEESDVDPTDIILTVAFTDDPQSHEGELRETWGGPLCLVQHERTYDELREIQNEGLADIASEWELEIVWSDVNVVKGVVEAGVVVIDDETREEIDASFGEETIRFFPEFLPVDG